LLILAAAILAVTAAILARHLQELRKAQKEYEKAREAVEDIVLSFNRQFKRVGERLELVAYKVEANTSRSDRAINKSEEVEKQLRALDERFGSSLEDKGRVSARVDEVNQRVRDVAALQEALTTRISGLEEQAKKLSVIPEPNVEAAIPIRRDKALAPLTGTELAALEMLAAEGPKTAPEIRWRIRLSREHTARLMKKLYEEGYLERDPSKIPFKYSVKKEMEKLLKKTEGQAA
jgi:DNA repair exonuclease SbcCD ATPase subunit